MPSNMTDDFKSSLQTPKDVEDKKPKNETEKAPTNPSNLGDRDRTISCPYE